MYHEKSSGYQIENMFWILGEEINYTCMICIRNDSYMCVCFHTPQSCTGCFTTFIEWHLQCTCAVMYVPPLMDKSLGTYVEFAWILIHIKQRVTHHLNWYPVPSPIPSSIWKGTLHMRSFSCWVSTLLWVGEGATAMHFSNDSCAFSKKKKIQIHVPVGAVKQVHVIHVFFIVFLFLFS